jgi:uncharacterized membrane protein YedE/YeeE
MLDSLRTPWPWYVAGTIIGLTVPVLLLLGNRLFGLSSSLRHICAAYIPANVPFFKYNWKAEVWNLFFVAGIVIGAAFANTFLADPENITIAQATVSELRAEGIRDFNHLMPGDIFSWAGLFTLRGFLFIVVGGFFVGFGTRYAGGCTSGHGVTGLSTLQWPSLVAVTCFMLGGFATTHLLLPYLLSL